MHGTNVLIMWLPFNFVHYTFTAILYIRTKKIYQISIGHLTSHVQKVDCTKNCLNFFQSTTGIFLKTERTFVVLVIKRKKKGDKKYHPTSS